MTDLSWLVGDETVRPCQAMLLDEADLVAWTMIDGGPPRAVRLTAIDGGRILVNGEDEERLDAMALVGVFEEMESAGALPGEVVAMSEF